MQRPRQQKATLQQRQALFDFMRQHSQLGKGRLPGPDGARQKKVLLGELAVLLNSMGSGVSKTPDKWFKSWLDWKSDLKSKQAAINAARRGTGGGPPPPPLTPLEEQVLEFHGVEMVEGLQVPDPLEEDLTHAPPLEVEMEVEVEESPPSDEPPCPPSSARAPRVTRSDPVLEVLERQARAQEGIAPALLAIAAAINRLADAMQNF